MFIAKSIFFATMTLSSCAFSLETVKEFAIEGSEIPAKLCKIVNFEDSIIPELLKANTKGLIDFHQSDIDQDPDSKFKKSDERLINEKIPQCEQQIREGKLLLGLLYHQDKLFGGSCHCYLKDEKTVLMRGTWFDRSASAAHIGAAQLQFISYMTSRSNFPEAEKMVVCMRDNSKDIPILTHFGFVRDLEFKVPEGNPVNIIAFKKVITQ